MNKKLLTIIIGIILLTIAMVLISINLKNIKNEDEKVSRQTINQTTEKYKTIETSKEIQTTTTPLTNTNTTTQLTTNNSKKTTTLKQTTEKTTKKEESTTKSTTMKTTMKTTTTQNLTVEKRVCTNNDSGWQKEIDSCKSQKEVIFNSFDEAISYGKYASEEAGYGYWYTPTARHYEDSSCQIDYYTVTLYIPKKLCLLDDGSYNPTIYIEATPKEQLIGTIDYLVKKGYNCAGKIDRLSGNIY